jgi:hypothetical protein
MAFEQFGKSSAFMSARLQPKAAVTNSIEFCHHNYIMSGSLVMVPK